MKSVLLPVLLTGVTLAANLPQAALEQLVASYPDALVRVDGQKLYFQDGSTLKLHTRGPVKSYAELLDQADLLDQVAAGYPACAPLKTPAYLEDPGRARSEALFRKLYGSTPEAVQKNLTKVDWFGTPVLFNRLHGASAALKRVAQEMEQQHPDLVARFKVSQGTYFWRKVAGTQRLSMHSFGIAIDLDAQHADYWKWQGYTEGQKNIRYHNNFPEKLVHLFEKHGFIWGGRWYHHDTMHFEYRPEMINNKACKSQ